jgi:hypothetical protein
LSSISNSRRGRNLAVSVASTGCVGTSRTPSTEASAYGI